MSLRPEWRRLHEARFAALPEYCGNDLDPGVYTGPDFRDWSMNVSSDDQHRIERYIDRFDLRSRRVLHVGIGNSGLARRFAGRVKEIVGTTIDEPEAEVGRNASIPGYAVLKQNKYSGTAALLPGKFAFIVDNNLTSACCCLTHLAAMLDMYAAKLTTDGQIVTDLEGLGWTPPGVNLRWRFGLEDLLAIAAASGLIVTRMNRYVCVLSKSQPLAPGTLSRLRNIFRQVLRLPGRAFRKMRAKR